MMCSPSEQGEGRGLSGTPAWGLLREPGASAHLLEEAEGRGSDAANDMNTTGFALAA